MSRSAFRMSIEFAMLDGRKECVPGFEDSSGGHITFKSWPCKIKLVGPGSHVFDGFNGEPFDREAWVSHMIEKFKEEMTLDAHFGGVLKSLFGNVFDQAKTHCDEHHADVKERFNQKK